VSETNACFSDGEHTIDRFIARDVHHTVCNILLRSKLDASVDKPFFVFSSANCALDPARGNVVDSDALLMAVASDCTHESTKGVFCACILPVALSCMSLSFASAWSSGCSAYRRVNPGHHASCDDEASIPIVSIRLFPEIVYGKFPGVQCSVQVNTNDIQIWLGRLSLGILRTCQ